MAIDFDTRANCFCTNGLQMYVKHPYKCRQLSILLTGRQKEMLKKC